MYDDTYYNDSYSTTYSSSSADPAAVFAILGFTFLFVIALYVVYAIFLGKIFKKAGVESWIAWVPFYNTWKLLEIGGQPGWWSVLQVVPIVNYVAAVFLYISMYNVGLKLQKEGVFVLLAIFLPIVWIIWLAVDSSKWDDGKGKPRLDRSATA